MTVKELIQILSKMPDDVEVFADESRIKKVTADIDLNGDIESINLKI